MSYKSLPDTEVDPTPFSWWVWCKVVWAALWNFQGQARAGWELSILSWMVLLRPLRLLQRLGEPLSILLHKHTLCTKTNRSLSSLCSSLRGLNSTIQLRIDSYQLAQACPWKFHNAVYTTIQYSITYTQGGTKRIHKITSRTTFRSSLCLNLLNRQLFTLRYLLYRVHWIKQPISKLPIMSFHEFFNQSGHFFEEKAITKKQTKTCSNWS